MIRLWFLQFVDVIDNLNKNWGILVCNLKCGNEDFWEYEWFKYGICFGFMQCEYFQNFVDFYNDYDIIGVFWDVGIVLDDCFYLIVEIFKVFVNFFGFVFEIECNIDFKGNR